MDVGQLQRDINARLASRRPSARIEVDGDYGPKTERAEIVAGFLMGVKPASGSKDAQARRRAVIRGARRTPAELARVAKRRVRERLLERKRTRAVGSGPSAALKEARKWIGRTESPPGSNRGSWGLTGWQQSFGSWLVGLAWCGVFVGHCLRRAGVKGLTARVASVAAIEADARAGRGGFRSWHGPTEGRTGDAVVIGGHGVHVELIEKRIPGGYQTIGGNTSPGNSGSQANGGGCWRRTRPYGAVTGCARPRY